MKRYRKFIRRLDFTLRCYWLPLALGFFLSGVFVIVELNVRGEFAIGGEWLFPIWFCLIHYFVRAHFREKARREKRHGRISRHPQAARR